MHRLKANIPFLLLTIHRFDVLLFLWVMKRKHLILWARLCRIFSRTADGYAYPILGLSAWYYGGEVGSSFALSLAAAFSFERPMYFVLKRGLKRNRPAAALPDYKSFIKPADQFSFPSGHTSGAFAIVALIALFYPQILYPALVWASLVGVSRVTLGVHFPSDILAGAVMGTGTACLASMWVLS